MVTRTVRLSGVGLFVALLAFLSLRPASAATQTIDWSSYPDGTPLSSVSEPGVTFTYSGAAFISGSVLRIGPTTGPSTVTMKLAGSATDLTFDYDSFGFCGTNVNSIVVKLAGAVVDSLGFLACEADSFHYSWDFDEVVWTAENPSTVDGMDVANITFETAGPAWAVSAKVGGGNVFNQFLPDFVPGTWSQKPVTVYLDCEARDIPIDLLRRDRSTTFRDGEWTYSTAPADVCEDELGQAAVPVDGWGPILVDTKPPVCRVTPSTQYVARGTTQFASFDLDISDATSGVASAVAAVSSSSGAQVGGVETQSWPPTRVILNVTMGTSTAGRVDYALTVTDNAGNQTTCKLIVRAK